MEIKQLKKTDSTKIKELKKNMICAIAFMCILSACNSGKATETNLEGAQFIQYPDLDFTKMSSTIMYSAVYEMMSMPDAYLGKTVKIAGPYYASYWEATNKCYHHIMIEDAIACCSQGVEFKVESNAFAYPDNYPSNDTWIEIVGTFRSYDEEGLLYFYVATDTINIKESK